MKFNHPDPILTAEALRQTYDSAEFTLATGQTDYNVKSNVANAFKNLKIYTTINIRSDQEITIKINSTSNSSITIEAGTPFELPNLMEIVNVFISNASGSTANIKIIGVNKGGSDGDL